MAKRKQGGNNWAAFRDLALFSFGVALFAGAYGYTAATKKWFPYHHVDEASAALDRVQETLGWKLPWYYKKVGNLPAAKTIQPGKVQSGLTLVTAMGKNNFPEANVIDAAGKVYQHWDLNFFNLVPDTSYLPPHSRPKSLPGPNIHGVQVQENGDLVFNFDWGGLLRLDACGKTLWHLKQRTHHSLYRDEDGNFWVPEVHRAQNYDPRLNGYIGGRNEYMIEKVSPQGKVLKQWRVYDILLNNGLESFLYITSRDSEEPHMSGDTLHMNDLEVFPRSMTPGIFRPGDLMISLRNINMVLVFDPATGKARHVFAGPFIRQHDPDFVDGNSITVLDNYAQTKDTPQQRSRILQVYADGRPSRILFEGTKKHPFFTDIMGKQELLANGNRLLTEATGGRALEIDAAGRPVWEYRNFVKPGVVALMDQAQRLPLSMDAAFFARARKACGAKN